MSKEQLQEQYGIKIDLKDGLYYTYNIFGRLLFISPNLSSIDKEMKKYYEEVK